MSIPCDAAVAVVSTLHVAKSEVAVVTLQPGTSGSIRPGGKWRPHGKGDRLERSSPPLGRNARQLDRRHLRRPPLVDPNRQRRGVVRELDWPDGDVRREMALRRVCRADRSDQRGRIRPRVGIESTRRCELLQRLSREHLVASERKLAGARAQAGVDADACAIGVAVGSIDLDLDPGAEEPGIDEMLAGCLGEPVVQQVEHHVVGPRLPKAIEEIVAALVPRDFEHRPSSTRDAVLEIDGTLLACALGRCAHRNDARGVVLPVPVEPHDAIAILQPCSKLEAVALSELRTRQHLLGAEAGFASECHCADPCPGRRWRRGPGCAGGHRGRR